MKWPVTTIGEVCEVVSGATPKTSKREFWNGNIPWVTPKDLSQLGQKHLSDSQRHITEAGLKSCSARMLPAQSVLLSSRAPIGLVAINTRPICTNQGFKSLVPRLDLISPDFLFWWLKTYEMLVQSKGRGATFREVSKKIVEDLQLPLPPLDEQRRIAEILDKADALRAKRRSALAKFDTLTQSLFLDMFGDPITNPMGWERCVVGDVVHTAKDGPHVSPTYAESGVPFLSTRHIKRGEIIWESLKYIDQEGANRQWKKCKPEFGDILYTKGRTTGIAARVNTSEPFAVWVHVALLKPIVNKVHPIWFEAMLNSAYCFTQSQRYTHGIANRDLGLKRMVKIQMYLPPLAEQRCFAAVVESVEQQKTSQRAHLANWTPSSRPRNPAHSGEICSDARGIHRRVVGDLAGNLAPARRATSGRG